MPDSRFYKALPPINAQDIAAFVEGDLVHDKTDAAFSRLASPDEDNLEDAIVYCADIQSLRRLADRPVGVCILNRKHADRADASFIDALIVAQDPRRAYAQIANKLWLSLEETAHASEEIAEPKIDASADIDPTAIIRPGAEIGANAVIGPHSVIGHGVVLGAGVRVSESVSISHAVVGAGTHILPGVRIGQAGFGFVTLANGLMRVPQLGRVIIDEDVEIGANTTIDRGALGDTRIGAGTKIDNLVQIGHNVRIGRNCIIVGQCGLSGSCTLGDGVVLGGQVGVKDHATVGAGAMVVARSGVMRDVPPGERWGGAPAQPITDAMRELAALSALAKKKKA